MLYIQVAPASFRMAIAGKESELTENMDLTDSGLLLKLRSRKIISRRHYQLVKVSSVILMIGGFAVSLIFTARAMLSSALCVLYGLVSVCICQKSVLYYNVQEGYATTRARCQLKSGKMLHKCSTDFA